jgi:general secretion pathway protein A
MDINYFGFSKSPFENNLDQRFLFFSKNHKEVAAALLYFIKWKKGFALVCGDVGTGKTMLINYLLSRLPDSVHPILIANPDAGYSVILEYIAGILKIDAGGKSLLDLVDQIQAALVEAARREERFVLIIDEAHLLSDTSIEQIRLLSNIEIQEHKPFQILLLGQNELTQKFSRPELRQLRQRININRFLSPMDAAETIQYIEHRLRMAGSSFDACFEPECRRLVFKMTKGVPRSINHLCDSALMVCKTENRLKVDRKILKKAAADLQSEILFMPVSPAGSTLPSWKLIRLIGACGIFAIFGVLLGIYAYQGAGAGSQNILSRLDSSEKSPESALSKTAENPADSAVPLPAGAHLREEKPLVLPEEGADLATESTSYSSGTAMQSPGSQMPENVIQLKKLVSVSRNPKRVVVGKGDTLIEIASRFFPGNKADGVKKILAANPKIGDMHLIYPGQKLVIPVAGSNRKDFN